MSNNKNDTEFSRSHLKPKYKLRSILETIILSFKLIPSNELSKFYLVLFSNCIQAFLSLLTIGFLIPLMYLALNPDEFFENNSHYFPLFLNQTNNETKIIFLCIIFIILALIKSIYTLFHNYVKDTYLKRLEIDLARDILGNINKVPYLWTVKKNQLYFREMALDRTSDWARHTLNYTMNFLGDLFFILMAFGGVLYTNFIFATYTSAFIIVSGFLIFKFIQPKLLMLSADRIKFARYSHLAAIDISTSGREIRFLGRLDALLSDFKLNHLKFGSSDVMQRLYRIIPKEALEFIATLVLASLILVGMTEYIEIESFKDSLILIVVLALRVLPLISKALNTLVLIEAQKVNISELTSFLSELKESKIENKNINKNKFKNWSKISFNKVEFLFEKNRGVKKINVNISRGENVCIVGDTGAGKTTFVDILSGLLLSQQGEVLIDNQHLTEENSDMWRHNIIYVPQNPIMIDATIKNNILWGRDTKSKRKLDITDVLDTVCLNEFVSSLDNGINTLIGDNGKQVSGGQKQRIALARALWSNASLIILDEATNALDPITETQIIKNFKSKTNKNVSYIFISHRLSIAKEVDKVIFFKDGQLFKVGSHKYLQKVSKEYRDLYNSS